MAQHVPILERIRSRPVSSNPPLAYEHEDARFYLVTPDELDEIHESLRSLRAYKSIGSVETITDLDTAARWNRTGPYDHPG